MAKERSIRYIRANQIFDSIKNFNRKHSVTRGEFSIKVPCLLGDMEWNQMDQLHRPFVHSTYQENIRIALGRDFASSLTKWGRWPFLITVTDMRVDKGLFYGNFTLGGIIFVHNTISFTEENEIIELRHEWIISSHPIFKPLHWILDRMWYKLDVRLQQEDAVIRAQRYKLRKLGYRFAHDDNLDFYTANLLTNNTIYPELPQNATIDLSTIPMDTITCREAGKVEFLVQKKGDEVLIWPAACPHEGAELKTGKLHEDCRFECPWHGLKFSAARLCATSPVAEIYGFHYALQQNTIVIRQLEKQSAAA